MRTKHTKNGNGSPNHSVWPLHLRELRRLPMPRLHVEHRHCRVEVLDGVFPARHQQPVDPGYPLLPALLLEHARHQENRSMPSCICCFVEYLWKVRFRARTLGAIEHGGGGVVSVLVGLLDPLCYFVASRVPHPLTHLVEAVLKLRVGDPLLEGHAGLGFLRAGLLVIGQLFLTANPHAQSQYMFILLNMKYLRQDTQGQAEEQLTKPIKHIKKASDINNNGDLRKWTDQKKRKLENKICESCSK